MIIKNAQTLPKVYYGLHFSPGVAEYREPGQEPYRIFINETTIKNMDPTFAGRPVYVHHVDEVNMDQLQETADGYVAESFYNSADGKHWVKFIVVSDRGHEAIRSGWKLSNAYVPKQMSQGGLWHGVEYAKEVTAAEYEHLAIVPNPRYEESIILTPEDFKAYNEKKLSELKRLANSKDKPTGVKSMFNFFKRSKVENSDELSTMLVTLPKSGKEMTITQLINAADELEEAKKNEAAEEEKKKKENSEEDEKKKNEESSEEKKENADEEEKKENDDSADEKKENAEEDEKKENEEDKKEKATQNALFESLKNAPNTVIQDTQTFELACDQVARGKSRYGSSK